MLLAVHPESESHTSEAALSILNTCAELLEGQKGYPERLLEMLGEYALRQMVQKLDLATAAALGEAKALLKTPCIHRLLSPNDAYPLLVH